MMKNTPMRLCRTKSILGLSLGILFILIQSALAKQYRIIKVAAPFGATGIRFSAKQKEYYVNIGRIDGIRPGSLLNVYRGAGRIDRFSENREDSLETLIGRIRLDDVRETISIGRIANLVIPENPTIRDGPVRVGNLVKPSFVMLNEILFDVNKAEIMPESEIELRRCANFIKAFATYNVLIEGHTDSDGSDEANLKLSERRAEQVKRYLVEKERVPEEILFTKGYGETRPIAPNTTPEGKIFNRRIELVIRE